MPTEIPVGYFQLTLDFTLPGQSGDINIVLGFAENIGYPADSRVALDIVQDFFVEQFLPTVATLDSATARFGPQPTGVVDYLTPDPLKPTVGMQGTNILPVNNAILIRKLSIFGGRENRGRMYVPGIDEDVVDNAGIIDPASVVVLQAAADDFLAEFVTASIPMVILHADPLTAPTLVTNLQVSNKMATQRTRLRD